MSHEDPGSVSYSEIGGLSEQIRELREVQQTISQQLNHTKQALHFWLFFGFYYSHSHKCICMICNRGSHMCFSRWHLLGWALIGGILFYMRKALRPDDELRFYFLSMESKTMLLLFCGRWLSCLWPTLSSSREWGSSPLKAACSTDLRVSSSEKMHLSLLGYITAVHSHHSTKTYLSRYLSLRH